ncbi:MAG TPA: hypothetical protein VHQ47_16975, partial [Phycisphaerae bacterium]|nr:hypothetical protein [Phycisphaerae bacterium]
ALAQPEGPGGGGGGGGGRVSAAQRATAGVVTLADRIGDVRIDGMTIGISKDFDGDGGWLIAVIHGVYDPVTVRQVVGFEAAARGRIATKIDGVDAIALDEGYLLLPSPTEMVILYDDDGTTRLAHAREMVAALKKWKGDLPEAGVLGKMVEGVQEGAVAWGASVGNDAMKKTPMFSAFGEMTLRAVRQGQKVNFTISSEADDAEAAKLGRDSLMQQVKAAISDFDNDTPLQPVAAMFRSIKVDLQGARATMTGSIPAEISATMMGAAEEIGGLSPEEGEGIGGAATQP